VTRKPAEWLRPKLIASMNSCADAGLH